MYLSFYIILQKDVFNSSAAFGTAFATVEETLLPMSTYTHANALQPRATYLYEKSNVINVSRKGRILSTAIGAGALAASRVIKQPFVNRLLKITGTFMLYRGISGNCPLTAVFNKAEATDMHAPAVNIRTSVLINQSKEVVYRFWKDVENLPVFMTHLKSVRVVDEKRSHWVIKTIKGLPIVEWEAEILENNGDVLSWRSMPGSMTETAGKITFEDWGDNKTQVDILLSYRPPAGYIGTAIGRLLQAPFKNIVQQDVENFKHYIEEGKLITVEVINGGYAYKY